MKEFYKYEWYVRGFLSFKPLFMKWFKGYFLRNDVDISSKLDERQEITGNIQNILLDQ